MKIHLWFYILLNPTLSKHAVQQLHDFLRITKHRKATIRRVKVLPSEKKTQEKKQVINSLHSFLSTYSPAQYLQKLVEKMHSSK